MGKVLIIKGADFSQNGIENYEMLIIDRTWGIENENRDAIPSSASFVDQDYKLLQGKVISAVEFKCGTAGNISIVKMNSMSSNCEIVHTITVKQNDVGLIKKFDMNIPVGNNDIIGISTPNDTGLFRYTNQFDSGYYFYYDCGKNSTVKTSTECLSVNWYIQN